MSNNLTPILMSGEHIHCGCALNSASYNCPFTISEETAQGETAVLDTLEVVSGGHLFIVNSALKVGDGTPNSKTDMARPARLVIDAGAIVSLVGNNQKNMMLTLGHVKDARVEICGGRLLLHDGKLIDTGEHSGEVVVYDGRIFGHEIQMTAQGSDLRIKKGLVRVDRITGRFSTHVESGLLNVKELADAGHIHIGADGCFLLGSNSLTTTTNMLGDRGINFTRPGGVFAIRINDTITSSREDTVPIAVADLFMDWMKNGKIRNNEDKISDFSDFALKVFTGQDHHQYASLRLREPGGEEDGTIARLIKRFVFGQTVREIPI